MKLGILVNTDRHLDDVVGIARAAIAKGHEVSIFMMDSGNYLLGKPEINSLSNESGVSMAYCDHSVQKLGISKEGLSEKMTCGSQFDNATMNSEADRVIVL
jgi:predicted peroxiredoxin